MKKVIVTGSFDDLRSRDIRFLEEAAKLGAVHVLLWSDEIVSSLEKKTPKFPMEERFYLLRAIRYVSQVAPADPVERDAIPGVDQIRPEMWLVDERDDNAQKRAYCQSRGLAYRVVKEDDLKSFPAERVDAAANQAPDKQEGRKKVIVTGCFDWFHSGHVRFFEEVSARGDLYVVVGHDKNVRLLKGAGHPMFSQDKRRYMVQSIRHVKQALVSTGHGWLDAEPEIDRIKPDMYAVNEDGDKPEKRTFCEKHDLEYVVLKRTPKEGLPKRESTALRGF